MFWDRCFLFYKENIYEINKAMATFKEELDNLNHFVIKEYITMTNTIKKIISVIITVIIMACLFAGCSTGKTKDDGKLTVLPR